MAEATPHSNAMNVDAVFDVLSNERRRIVLAHLLEQHSPVTVEELVERVVSAEASDQTRRDVLRKRVRVSLHHTHLPKLASSNLIDVDTERGSITVRESAYDVEPYLELAMEGDRNG